MSYTLDVNSSLLSKNIMEIKFEEINVLLSIQRLWKNFFRDKNLAFGLMRKESIASMRNGRCC